MTPIEQSREAVEQSDVERLEALIEIHPDLPNLRSEDNDRTLLHTIADYPGHKPKGIEMAGEPVRSAGMVARRELRPATFRPSTTIVGAV